MQTEDEDAALLPSIDQRQRLTDGLANLIARGGSGPFLTNAIVLPTPEFFPDPIPRTVGELRHLIGTLMAYAGLPDLGIEIHLYDSSHPYRVVDDEGREWAPPHEGAAAYFAGIKDGACQFGLDLRTLGDAERVLGILAHEVAHAYRERHRLYVKTRRTEEELTDLTTVYLGFGVLTANASYTSKSSGSVAGGWVTHRVEVARAGYLSPEDMAFLLALQITARGLRRAEVGRLVDELAPAQQSMFREARRVLLPDAADLSLRLGQSSGEARLPVLTSASVLASRRALEPSELDERELAAAMEDEASAEAAKGERAERPTYRIRAYGRVHGVVVGSIVGFAACVVFDIHIVAMLAAAIVGSLVALRLPIYRCTDPDCQAGVGADQPRCPGCGRPVARTITNERDRLDD